MSPSHYSAKPSHYDEQAEDYDAFNEKRSELINQVIENILKEHGASTVLDFTCGTGSQVFWLAKRGYEITGSDINAKMLDIAKAKAKREGLDVDLLEGDMRSTRVGKFDAVITIFNAVGHLTKPDFEKAMQNIRKNLNEGGLYVFDIFNLDYLTNGENITQLTIDWKTNSGNREVREIQYSTINEAGVLASYTTCHRGEEISRSMQTLQVYTAKQLQGMLERNGFEVVQQCAMDGSTLMKTDTERILTIARKR